MELSTQRWAEAAELAEKSLEVNDGLMDGPNLLEDLFIPPMLCFKIHDI